MRARLVAAQSTIQELEFGVLGRDTFSMEMEGAQVAKIAIAVVTTVGTVAATWLRFRSKSKSIAPPLAPSRKQIEAAFNRLERAVVDYLNAAGDLCTVLMGRGPVELRGNPAQGELDRRGTAVSAAYHRLNEEASQHLLGLHALLPGHEALFEDAEDIRKKVLQRVHAEGVLQINKLINLLNDDETSPVSEDTIRRALKEANVAASIVAKESALAKDRLTDLRRKFREAL